MPAILINNLYVTLSGNAVILSVDLGLLWQSQVLHVPEA